MLPTFLIIGATKCGTTSLHKYLSQHPQVFMHPQKELRFFTEEGNWHRGLAWYDAQFSEAGHRSVLGESTNDYSRHPLYTDVPKRISHVLPDVRLIYIIRHPIERIRSHYRHRLVTGMEWRSPNKAVQEDPRYIVGSRYGHQLEQYCSYFHHEQILTIRFEDLISHPQSTLRTVCRFLGVEEDSDIEFPRSNVTAERMVAPGVLRHLSRIPFLRKATKSASRFVNRTPLGPYLQWADQPAFQLGDVQYEELVSLFRKDADLLSRILGQTFDDWKF